MESFNDFNAIGSNSIVLDSNDKNFNIELKNKLNWIKENNPNLYDDLMTAPSKEALTYHLFGFIHLDYGDDFEDLRKGITNKLPKTVQAQKALLNKLNTDDLKWIKARIHPMEKPKFQKLIEEKENKEA